MTIHRNILGTPTSTATIAPIERILPKQYVPSIVGYKIDSVIENLVSPTFETFETAESWAVANGWTAEKYLDGHNNQRATITHSETAAAIAAMVASHDAKWATASSVYVRYGDLPVNGRSANHADGTAESGVSVYRGMYLEATGEAIALPATNAEACGMLTIADRQMYIVSGREVGTGSDGEPVLADAKIVAKAV